jgi:hypothetical protein
MVFYSSEYKNEEYFGVHIEVYKYFGIPLCVDPLGYGFLFWLDS